MSAEKQQSWERRTFMYVTISVGKPLACAAMAGMAWGRLTIVALSLFAQPCEESLAARVSVLCAALCLSPCPRTSRAADGVSMFIVRRADEGHLAGQQRRGSSADRAITYLSRHCEKMGVVVCVGVVVDVGVGC